MEQGARNFPTLRSMPRNVLKMVVSVFKPENPKEGELSDELIEALKIVDEMEKALRSGETEARVIGKNSFNKNFSRGKSKSIEKPKMKIEEKTQGEIFEDKGREIVE